MTVQQFPGAATEALMQANKAMERLDGHEKLCSDRWAELRKEITILKKQQWWFVGLMLLAQGSVIAFLVQRLP